MEKDNRLIARQTNLKILVDALCHYMRTLVIERVGIMYE